MVARTQAALRKAAEIPASALADEIIAGLTAKPKRIPPKYFYDEAGAQLFEAITATPEYYPTRCEIAILRDRAGEIARFIPAGAAVIEEQAHRRMAGGRLDQIAVEAGARDGVDALAIVLAVRLKSEFAGP